MTSYEIGLAVHIFGVMVFSGGALLAGVVFETASRRGRPSEVALLLGLTRSGALIVVAGAVLVFGAELSLAGEVDQFGEAWLLTSLVTYAYDALDRVTGGGELGAPLALDVGVVGDAACARPRRGDVETTHTLAGKVGAAPPAEYRSCERDSLPTRPPGGRR